MTPRKQRLLGVLLVVAGVVVATVFSLSAFEDSMMFYIELDDVVAGEVPKDKDFRIGGLVTEGSLRRAPGDIALSFTLNDMEHSVDVSYSGVLPDLFREGQGIIAHGRLNSQGIFEAHTVLAKHDENYMPPEVAESLKDKVHGAGPES